VQQFYCPHARAGGSQRILIREKTLEFSTVLSTLCSYLLKIVSHWEMLSEIFNGILFCRTLYIMTSPDAYSLMLTKTVR